MALHIRFKKLVIDNFLSIGHGEVDLENRGYTLIEGINNDPRDGAKSNGSGKSSLASAICYALTGETIQGVSSFSVVNRNTEGDMSVDLTFSVNETEFRVIRTRDRKNKANLKIYIDGEDRSGKTLRDGEAILKQYLPSINSEFLGELIIIGQGMPHRFSRCKSSERKEILENLSNNTLAIEDISERVKGRLDTLKSRVSEAETERTKLDTENTLYTKQKADNDAKLESLRTNAEADYSHEIAVCEEKVKVLTEARQNALKAYQEADEKLTKDRAEKSDISDKENRELNDNREEYQKAHSPIVSQLSDTKAALDLLIKDIAKKEKITDICPTCGQRISGVHKPDLTEDCKRRDELKAKVDELRRKSDEQDSAFDLNTRSIKDYYAEQIKGIQARIDEESKKASELKRASLDTSELDRETARLNELKTAQNLAKARLKEAEEKSEELTKKLDTLQEKIVYNTNEIQNLQDRVRIVSSMDTFVKRDFRGLLLSHVITYLDSVAKSYAEKIFGNDDIDFVLDGNDIDIRYHGRLLETLSGGEQRKVDLIVQFALRAMVREYADFDSNVIVLDEILDNLDSVGCDEVLNFINTELSDIESVFIISHHADSLNICNDSTIKVVKNERGVSYISEE